MHDRNAYRVTVRNRDGRVHLIVRNVAGRAGTRRLTLACPSVRTGAAREVNARPADVRARMPWQLTCTACAAAAGLVAS